MPEVQRDSNCADQAITPIQSEYPDPRDRSYFEWNESAIKEIPTVLSDTLTRIVTLSTALIGGSVYFLNESVMDRFFRVGMTVCFTVALALAFYGLWPRNGLVDSSDPDDIRHWKSYVIDHKTTWMRFAGIALITGVIMAIVGMIMK